MRTLALSLTLLLLAGCATAGKIKSSWDGPTAEADQATCHTVTDTMTVSTGRKVAIYATNVLVIPVSTALTLGFMPLYMHPMSDIEWQAYNYKLCMARLGYEMK